MYALLEDRFQVSDQDIVNIQLFKINSDRLCASVLFSSGFKAWNLVRTFKKSSAGLGWSMRIDSGASAFEHVKKYYSEKREDFAYDNDSRSKYNTSSYNTSNSNMKNTRNREDYYSPSQRQTSHKSTCNPFVPCLKISFSCERKLPFRLDKSVLVSLFPISRFPSFSGVEEGRSSWHCHFGREIDVVEADRMLFSDTFEWKNHKFFFEEWSLIKGNEPWAIPDHYKDKMILDDNSNRSTNNTTNNNTINSQETMESSIITSVTETISVPQDLISKLPKFIKKRKISESAESEGSEPEESVAATVNKSAEDGIKVKVKRKPLKKLPFVPPTCTVPPVLIEEEQPAPVEQPTESTSTFIVVHEELECPILSSGSARTEGYFKLPEAEKKRVKFNGILEAFSSISSSGSNSGNSATSMTSTSGNADSRSSRAQNRRPLLIPSASNVTMDLFKVSPLQSAQKLVALRNSSIHSYGLVLMEAADAGDLIIEYVGELVRASVANIREWKYEREYRGDGIASSYLFRLDGIMVIDATHQGNLARFINHSCDPNCVAKTITLNGSKRIVMYAKKPIKPGEEITYDYKFPIEKDPKKKVKCLCGTSSCRKYLN